MEELRITPAKVVRVHYMQETLMCPVCRQEDETTIVEAKTPTALLAHSPASPDMVAMVMYQKSFLHLPFYRQSKDWMEKGVPVPRETAAHWYNYCSLEYLSPVYEVMHQELLAREILHADEVPCQVLHEEGKTATSKSYMWIYLSGTDGKPPIILYDYRPGRSEDYPIEFLRGFNGMLHCDGYSAYGRIEDVVLVCCLAHCRRKFFEAVPKTRQKKLKLLDINSEQELAEPPEGTADNSSLLPAEKGVAFCNRLFYMERLYKELPQEERKEKHQKTEPAIWDEFWKWLETLDPADGATASAIVLSLIETAKANNLNIYHYLYTLLLYMPDYKNEPAGIKQLLPWSEFIKERCTGIIDIEKVRPEERGNLNI